MYDYLKGKGLIAFSDPAGAKACLSLATILQHRNKDTEFRVVSNKSYDFYKHWNMPVEILSTPEIGRISSQPDWLFTGTSHPDSSDKFEIGLIREAKKLKIPSWSFIDHWTSLALRFCDEGEFIWPDKIIVLDKLAKKIAIDEGIPEELIYVHPNPYIEYIKNYWKPTLAVDQIKEQIGIKDQSGSLILYAPDPLSLRDEDVFWGFSEASVLKDLLEVCINIRATVLLIKKHPLQPPNVLEEVIQESLSSVPVYFVSEINNLELINISSLVIGFHSNFLIEAGALNKPIIRYYPSFAHLDPISHLKIGHKVTDKMLLSDLIKNIINP